MLQSGQEVYFHDNSGTYKGYVEKENKHTINILVDDDNKPEGYQLWRVTDFFLSSTPEEAVQKWENYRGRLREYKKLLRIKRGSNAFYPGSRVVVHPLENPPYSGTVIEINRITLNVSTDDGRLMRVDKAICEPEKITMH